MATGVYETFNNLAAVSPANPTVFEHYRKDLKLPSSDEDFGAYYNWVNQQRLAGAEKPGFLVWFEGHQSALAIGPSLPQHTESDAQANLARLLEWLV